MRSLKALQETFCSDLLNENSDGQYPYIMENGLTTASRLDIYRHNVFHNYHQALRAVYPVVERLVGEAFFKRLTYQYIRLYPSSSGDLNDYGAFFPQYLQNCAAVEALVYLSDVAYLEWAIEKVFHAASHEKLSLTDLQEIPADQYGDLNFQLHPATQLFRSEFPILAIWQANQPESADDAMIDLDQGEECLLIYRDHFSVAMRKLSRAEFFLLQALQVGSSFSDAYTSAMQTSRDFDIATFLQAYIASNVLVGFSLPDNNHQPISAAESSLIKI